MITFSASRLHMPCPTASMSGCVADIKLAAEISYIVPFKLPKVGMAESVGDMFTLLERVERLVASPGTEALQCLCEWILELASTVRS